ncbi:MAG TPA: glycoside hydrolase family 28 protein [Candidatus Acidoferrales bacterium]|jgi:polygalacturonase|nr:glycoside hydrolase family 28 protein [Candidatus Acidoferrales bacterium]
MAIKRAPQERSLFLYMEQKYLTTKLLPISFFALAVGVAALSDVASGADFNAAGAWQNVPAILSRITSPTFPDQKFPVTNYGAVGDGTTDCTEAFRNAIGACSDAGGGEVMVPAGTYLTGAIHLRSNVNLHIEKDATIRFTTDREKYMPVVLVRYEGTEIMNYSPLVYAFEQTNIAITGEGTLDGQGSAWHQWKSSTDPKLPVEMGNRGVPLEQRIFGDGHRLRPNFVVPFRCGNVLIEGVHIINSPMWVMNPVYCTNVTVQNVTVDTTGPNTDGCDPDSCDGVLIKDCDFSDGDDCIAIKSGRDRDGQKVNIPCKDIVVENCQFKAGHGGIGIGSETSGGVQNVFGENCHFDSPDLEMAIRLKTNPARGGYIRDVYVRDCEVKLAKIGIDMTLRYSSSGAMEGSSVPIISDIDIRDTTFEELTKQPVYIEGWSPSKQITDITIANCRFLKAMENSYVTNAARIQLSDDSGLEQKAF